MWVRSDTCEPNEPSEPSETTETNKASKTSEPEKLAKLVKLFSELVNQATDDEELPSDPPMPSAMNVVQLSKHCL